MDSRNISEDAGAHAAGREPGRMAVVLPYWDFWETAVPWDFRADREALLAEAVEIASRAGTVAIAAVLPDERTAVALRSKLHDIDAVVVVSTMAVPSATTMALLADLEHTPVLVWALSRMPELAQGFSHRHHNRRFPGGNSDGYQCTRSGKPPL